jgi:opacity protein-like surface antigen
VASGRLHGDSPDHLGVSITYNYQLTTPLGAAMSLATRKAGSAWSTIPMTDSTVMALEPTTN